MNWKILLFLVIVGLSLMTFSEYRRRQSDPDILFANLIKQMKEGKYEDIYENSSDFLHLNANKEKFTERMSDALEKMKMADGELNFKRDKAEEIDINSSLDVSDKAIGRNSSYKHTLIIEKLGTGDTEVTVVIFFDNKSLVPKFNDLAVMPRKNERQDLYVKGIAYKK